MSAFIRRHWLLLALVLAGAVLRVLVMVAYRPALVYFDSVSYLSNAQSLSPSELRPLGYSVFLRVLPLFGELAVVPAVQHLMGLALGVLIYVLLARLGVPRWGAALAAAPVLLDAYQLNIEHYVLSETVYESLVVGGCAAVLWRRRPSVALAVLAGLLLAGAALTRASGLLVVVPAAIAVALLARRPAPVLALVIAFGVPVGAYSFVIKAKHGAFGVTTQGGRFVYARVAPFADCTKLTVPRYERPLCEPNGNRASVESYMWSKKRSPIFDVKVPPGMRRAEVAGDFARRVIRHQPDEYVRTVLDDFLRGFAWRRERGPGELPIERWRFQTAYPVFREDIPAVLRRFGYERGRGEVDVGVARMLRSYQRLGYVPNLLLGLGLLAAFAAAAGVGRARRSGLRVATLLFALMGLAVLLPTVAANQFTWRYQVPQLVLLAPAAALAMTALRHRAGTITADPVGGRSLAAQGDPP